MGEPLHSIFILCDHTTILIYSQGNEAPAYYALTAHLTLVHKCARLLSNKPLGAFKNGKNMMNRLIGYIKETRLEMRKVTWPTRQQTIHFTVMVIIVSVGTALILGGFDFLFRALLARFI